MKNLTESLSRLLTSISFSRLRHIAVVLVASVFLLVTTACTPADTASTSSVPEASTADVQRAQSNMSDQAIDEDALSKQGTSRARRGDDIVSPQ